MPVRKVAGGYKWGTKGKIYKSKAKAEKQGRAQPHPRGLTVGRGWQEASGACLLNPSPRRGTARRVGVPNGPGRRVAMLRGVAVGGSDLL